MLRRRGFDVEFYFEPSQCPLYDTQCGRERTPSSSPDIIITDFDMPYVNGVEFVETLRKNGYECSRIAMMSGSAIPPSMLERAARMNIKFFAKPFHIDQIGAWLREVQPGPCSGNAKGISDGQCRSIAE